jgi:hypothetical protein
MKLTFALIALALLLTACRRTPSDEQIRQQMIGTWQTGRGTIEHRADGSYVHRFVINVTNDVTHEGTHLTEAGTWQVKDGCILTVITNEPWSNTDHTISHFQVVRLADHELVIRDLATGFTNEIVVHKQ